MQVWLMNKKLWLKLLTSLGLIALLTACTPDRLSLFTAYINRESLASHYVGTPDPCLRELPEGQRLFVKWNVPAHYRRSMPMKLFLQIRLRDRTEISQTLTIFKCRGTYLYELVGKPFFESGGILTYRAKLFAGDQCLGEWRHQIWVDLITVGQGCGDSDNDRAADDFQEADWGDEADSADMDDGEE
jgi:hypothetical protein